MEDIIEKSKQYAIDCHRKKNNMYDGMPYEYHLGMVVEILEKYEHLITAEERANVIGGGYNHDTIEDCGITFNDLKNATNEEVAELAYACTNEKGKTRAERANSKYYRGIRRKKRAKPIKLADRISHLKHAIRTGKLGMYKKYQNENPKFIWGLVKPEWYQVHLWIQRFLMGKNNFVIFRTATDHYAEMFVELDYFINLKKDAK